MNSYDSNSIQATPPPDRRFANSPVHTPRSNDGFGEARTTFEAVNQFNHISPVPPPVNNNNSDVYQSRDATNKSVCI